MLRAASTHCFLLESAEAEERWGRYTFLGLKPSLEFCCSGGVARIRKNIETDRETCEIFKVEHPSTVIRRIIAENKSPRLEGFPPFAGGLVGYFSFDYLSYSEPSLRRHHSTNDFQATENELFEKEFLDVDLMLFESILVFDSYRQKISCITGVRTDDLETSQLERSYEKAQQELDTLEKLLRTGKRKSFEPLHLKHELTPRFSETEYTEMVDRAKRYIYEGDIFQVVLSNPLTAPATGSLFDTYRVLRSENPSPYAFCRNYYRQSV